jgi:23S rRNA (uracil1939-C5)-methyltransferase
MTPPPTLPPAAELEVDVTSLAAGGDGVARDESGRVTFVPRTAPGDRARIRLTKQTKSFARGELLSVVRPSTLRTAPPCEYFIAGCGGCQWQHVERAAQLEAKHAIVTNALRKLPGLVIEAVLDPAPPYGWRRRARFHVLAGKVGLYAYASHDLIPIAHCPQLEPELDAALAAVAAASPPDGELALLRGHRGDIVVGTEHAWPGGATLVGRAGIVGVVADPQQSASRRARDLDRDDDARPRPAEVSFGRTVIEVEPGLVGGPWDFAQASAAGNAALIGIVRHAVGHSAAGHSAAGHSAAGHSAAGHSEPGHSEPGQSEPGRSPAGHSEPGQSEPGHSPAGRSEPGQSEPGQSEPGHSPAGGSALGRRARLLELHAGAGNFTRTFVADGWDVLASDVVEPAQRVAGARFVVGSAEEVVARRLGHASRKDAAARAGGRPTPAVDAVVLDPPRTGALEAMAGIAELAPPVIVYVSCDPATLARDAEKLVAAGYRAERAWPVDLMPQTSHIEVVLRLVR